MDTKQNQFGMMGDNAGGTTGGGTTPGLVNAGIEDSYWRESWRSRPYFSADASYDDFAPAYRTGWEAWATHGASGKRFEDIEPDLKSSWNSARGTSSLGWEKAKLAVRDAWDRVKQGLGAATSSATNDRWNVDTQPSLMGGSDGDLGSSRLGDADAYGINAGTTSIGGGSASGSGGSFAGASSGASIVGASSVGGVDTAKGGLGTGGYRSGDGFNYGYAGTSASAPEMTVGPKADTGHGGTDEDVRILNSYLRGEISACETYRQAIARVGTTYPQLADGLSSHERRVALLNDRIRSLGGEPTTGSGMWGAWAKLLQAGADLFGERSAIATLESGEDHGRNDYQRELPRLSAAVRAWVDRELLPEEERTHAMLSDLKHAQV